MARGIPKGPILIAINNKHAPRWFAKLWARHHSKGRAKRTMVLQRYEEKQAHERFKATLAVGDRWRWRHRVVECDCGNIIARSRALETHKELAAVEFLPQHADLYDLAKARHNPRTER